MAQVTARLDGVGPSAGLDAAERGDGARRLRRRELREPGGDDRFTRRDDGFVIETEDADGQRRSFDVVGVAGIRPLQQYLLSPAPGRTQAFDIAWDTERHRWYDLYPDQVLQPHDGLHWTGPYKSWEARCAECHATGFSRNYDMAAPQLRAAAGGDRGRLRGLPRAGRGACGLGGGPGGL